MSLAHASVSVLRTCLVQVVRGADSFALRLLQRTEHALEQSLSTGFHSSKRDVLCAALHNLQQHRASVLHSFPQNLLEALVLSARQPFSFSAQAQDSGGDQFSPLSLMAESARRQLKVEHRLVQMVEPQVELVLADLDALMSGAQGLEFVQPQCNPLRLENYVRALSQSLTALQPVAEVAECWHELISQCLGPILVSEYARVTGFLRQKGVQPAQYGCTNDTQSPCLLTLRVLQELASDLRWIDDQRCTVPQSLTDSMLAGWGMPGPASSSAGLEPGWTSYSANALQTSLQPWLPSVLGEEPVASQAPSSLIQVRTLQRMMSHMTSDGRLLPSVQRVLVRLEPLLRQLVVQDARFFEDRGHPARQLLDEMTARSLWFSSETDLGFGHFISVSESAAVKLLAVGDASAYAFASALQYVRDQWPPEGRMSRIGALTSAAEGEQSTQQGLMSSVLGLAERQIVKDVEQSLPDGAQLAKMIRSLPSAKGVPEDILDFVTGPWARVIALAQQQETSGQERDPGGYLALVPSLLWSVSPLAAQDATRLVAIAPRLQRRLARGLRSVGRTEVEIAALAARLGSLHQRALDAAGAAHHSPADGFPATDVLDTLPSVLAGLDSAQKTVKVDLDITLPVLTQKVSQELPELTLMVRQSRPVPLADAHILPDANIKQEIHEAEVVAEPILVKSLAETAASGSFLQEQSQEMVEWPLGTWVELSSERQQVRTKLTWVSPQQSLFLFTAEDGSTQSMTRRMRDKLLSQGQLRRLKALP